MPFFKLLEDLYLPLISHHPHHPYRQVFEEMFETVKDTPKSVSRHLGAYVTTVNCSETLTYCRCPSGPLLLYVHMYHFGAFEFQVGT